MVRTRHSLPNPDAADEDITIDPKLAKKLHIDGKGALVGEKVEKNDDGPVYRFRGAAYAVTDGTKQEWLNQEPERYKRKRGSISPEDQKRAGNEDGHVTGGAAETPTKAGKKRAFHSLDGAGDEDDDEEEEQQPPSSKRSRRSQPTVYYGRQKRKRKTNDDSSTSNKRRRTSTNTRQVAAPSFPSYDYTRIGGHEDISCIEASRLRAKAQGLDVDPIHKMRPLPPSPDLAALDRTIAGQIVDLVKLNGRRANLYEERSPIDAVWPKERLEESMIERERSYGSGGSRAERLRSLGLATATAPLDGSSTTIDSDQRDRTPQANSSKAIQREQATQPTPSTSSASARSTSVEIITSRHDSAASITPTLSNTTLPPAAATKATSTIPPNPYTTNLTQEADNPLPTSNKAGQKLRWSLPGAAANDERAEAAINFARMEGESHSARRRRIKRELSLVKGWDVSQGDEDSIRGEDMGV
jgi:hypothetical protein